MRIPLFYSKIYTLVVCAGTDVILAVVTIVGLVACNFPNNKWTCCPLCVSPQEILLTISGMLPDHLRYIYLSTSGDTPDTLTCIF